MTDLERFFRRLVDNLIAIDPARLHRPLRVGEIYDSIIPYRTNRRSLELESNEDYDMLLLRLCAGEGGYFQTATEELQSQFAAEAGSTNPNLNLLHELADAELRLATVALAHALGPDPEGVFAAPEAEIEDVPEVPLVEVRPEPPEPDLPREVLPFSLPESDLAREAPRPATGARCSFCGGTLPANRTVNFCPHCGQNQVYTRCPECQSEIELGWKHCVNCGHRVAES